MVCLLNVKKTDLYSAIKSEDSEVLCKLWRAITLRPRTTSRSVLRRLCRDQAGIEEQNSARMVFLSDVVCISLIASETDGHAGHCKNNTVQGFSNTLYTPVLDLGQRRTPSIHRLWRRTLGRALGWPQHWLWAVIPASGAHSHPKRKGKEGIHCCFQQWKNFQNRLTVEVIAKRLTPLF